MSKIQTTEQPGSSVNLTEVQNRCMQKIKTEAGSSWLLGLRKKSGWHFRQLRELAKSDHNGVKIFERSLNLCSSPIPQVIFRQLSVLDFSKV